MTQDSYRVVVTREDGAWLAEIPGLDGGHTYARTLSGLDRSVREVIVLAADLPDEAMAGLTLGYEYRTGDPDVDDAAAEVRTIRREADKVTAAATAKTAQAAVQLVRRGLSVRDTAAMLGISPQRVSQLTDTAKAS